MFRDLLTSLTLKDVEQLIEENLTPAVRDSRVRCDKQHEERCRREDDAYSFLSEVRAGGSRALDSTIRVSHGHLRIIDKGLKLYDDLWDLAVEIARRRFGRDAVGSALSRLGC